jgi:DNA-binding transcriptional LysR family regulator
MIALEQLGPIRIKDLQIFNEVSRAKSIREAGRRLNLGSGQISKSIKLLELRFGLRLFKRSSSGVLLTDLGVELLKVSEEILANGQKMELLLTGKKGAVPKQSLAVASTAFLTTRLVAPAISRLAPQFADTNFRFLDLAPDQLVPAGLRGAFDCAIHLGKIPWPTTWECAHLGKIVWSLCVRAKHNLTHRPSLAAVLEHPFVVPTYWTQEGLARGNDHFPISMTKRKIGFETATADAAIPILLHTDQVGFLPSILTAPLVKKGQLRELNVADISAVKKDLYIAGRADTVGDRFFKKLTETLRLAIS